MGTRACLGIFGWCEICRRFDFLPSPGASGFRRGQKGLEKCSQWNKMNGVYWRWAHPFCGRDMRMRGASWLEWSNPAGEHVFELRRATRLRQTVRGAAVLPRRPYSPAGWCL